MKLILTRHGETIENKEHVLQGHLPGRLSELGIEQAKKLALRLKDEKIDLIYSSDLARATDTAKEIAKYHPEAPIHFVTELREKNLGSFTGRKREDADWNNPPEDAEPRESMRKRVKKLLDDIYDEHPDATVLFVGHGGINKAVITVIMDKPAEYMSKIEDSPNTGITIFEIKEDKNHVIHLLNCAKHLE